MTTRFKHLATAFEPFMLLMGVIGPLATLPQLYKLLANTL